MTALVIPDPQQLSSVQAQALCNEIVVWAQSVDDVAAVDEARRRMDAIEQYLAGSEASGHAQTASRLLEARIGELLGDPAPGGRGKKLSNALDSLSADERVWFRKLAQRRPKWEPSLPLSRRAALALAGDKSAAHVSANSGENEWYTPREYIESAVLVMGGIDLDPASSETANSVVGATRFFSAEDDGLSQPWNGRVWMNPPYAQPLVGRFADKLAEEAAYGNVEQAIVLVNNATETVWFQRLMEVGAALCFPSGRIKFWHPDRVSAPLQGQAVIYVGENVDAFRSVFLRFGFTVAV